MIEQMESFQLKFTGTLMVMVFIAQTKCQKMMDFTAVPGSFPEVLQQISTSNQVRSRGRCSSSCCTMARASCPSPGTSEPSQGPDCHPVGQTKLLFCRQSPTASARDSRGKMMLLLGVLGVSCCCSDTGAVLAWGPQGWKNPLLLNEARQTWQY